MALSSPSLRTVLPYAFGIITLLLLLTPTAKCFQVVNTASPFRTRTGCTVVLTCGGFGERIEWRRFGQIRPLENHTVTTQSLDVNMSTPYQIANASISASPSINNQRYTCLIFESPPGRTLTHQVLLSVAPEVVVIDPMIKQEIDISSYHTNSKITIGCPVQTCAKQVTVQFLKGDNVIQENMETPSGETSSYNLVLTVSESITGLYACKVDTARPDDSTIMTFNIIGTPLPAPSTNPPPTVTPADTSTTSTTSTGSTDSTGTPRNAAVTGKPPILSVATFLLTVAVLLWL